MNGFSKITQPSLSNLSKINADSLIVNKSADFTNTDNVYLPRLDNDLICTITPRTTGANLAGIVEINGTGVYGYEFPANAIKEVSFQVQLSHQWEPGTNIVPHFHWVASHGDTGNAVFKMDYWCVNFGETIPGATGLTTLSKTSTP